MKRAAFFFGLVVLAMAIQTQSGPLDGKERLTLSLEAVPLAKVLNMVAAQNKLNLVLSDQVEGTISIRLDSVDLRTALDAILLANGYAYVVRDNVVIVKSAAKSTAEDLVSRVVTLKYLDPITAKKGLESSRSDMGKLVVLDRIAGEPTGQETYKANRILITDFPSSVERLVRLLEDLDVPERTILIEAKIVETTLDDNTKLGFAWPVAVSSKISGADDGTGSSTTTLTNSNRNTGVIDLETGRWVWGKLSVDQVSLVLDALDKNGHSKLLSDPRITTVENHEAVISVATVIPIQTINRFTEAASTQDIVTFQDEEVGISLKVTPRINEAGKITLDVEPTVEDIIGYSGTAGNQKPITASRSIKTRITVNDGETVALGGLLKEDERITTQRVPLLGHIPLLGGLLFTNKAREKTTTDLVILITPHVLP